MKMKVKDVEDLDENSPANVPFQPAYVRENERFYVQPFVRGT